MKQMLAESNELVLARLLWDFMRVDSKLDRADVIVGLGSNDIRTAEWCAKLYTEGWAPKILFSGGRGPRTRYQGNESEADVYARRSIELGVPDAHIIREDRATNSGENILYVADKLKNESIPYRKIILVHKPYMLRRAYATFEKQWPLKFKPEIICSALDISFDEYVKNRDYPFDYVVNVMVGDLQRIIEYPKLGFQVEQKIPENVLMAYELLIERGYTSHLIEQ